MKKRILTLLLALTLVLSLLPAASLRTLAAEALPTELVLAPSAENGLPSGISLIKTTENNSPLYSLYLPGNAVLSQCFLSWEGGLSAADGDALYPSGELPVPAPGETKTYTFTLGSQTASFRVRCWQGSAAVKPIFIEIDESKGTIAAMNNDPQHNTECSGQVYIDGELHTLSKMKGRGNYAWSQSKDKRAYNITLGAKTNLLGIDSDKTKKWSLLANVCDHSLLRDKVGYDLGYELGIGLDSASADVWMNGVYQGTYLVTPKTDSFTSKDGYLLENDNNTEPAISAGGDPSFTLKGLFGSSGNDVNNNGDNRITVKDIGDNVLLNEAGEVDESEANLNRVTAMIQAHLQDAWDAIRSDTGYNDKGVYYADYIDLTSFAKMYLVLEYCKDYDVCAGSNFFQRYGTAETDKYYAGPVWDLDSSLGCTQENGALRLASDISMTTGYGFFIRNIYDYRTSIYKNLGKHEDFMDEVLEVYNQYKDVFDAIPGKVDAFSAEIRDSAMMNFQKVDPVDNYNIARYRTQTVKNAGTDYEQVYLATTDSKTDWPNYIANLRTFCAARTKFFAEYMVEPYSNPIVGEAGADLAPNGHVYSDYTASWENLNGINNPDFEPTSSNMGIGLGWGNWSQTTGSVHYVGFTWDGAVTVDSVDLYWYDDNGGTRVPSDFHLEYLDENGAFQPITCRESVANSKALNQYNRLTFPAVTTKDLRLVMTTASNASGIYRFKVYNAVELEGIPVVFHTTKRATVSAFDTQDVSGEGTVVEYAFARNSATGEIDNSGSGQVNFRVNPAEGYKVVNVIAEPADHFANLKGPTDTGAANTYRLTKVTDRVDITVQVAKITGDEPEEPEPCTHEFDDEGVCIHCGVAVPRVRFDCDAHVSVTVYDTQDLTQPGTEQAVFAFARGSADGALDADGEGQVNFVVVPEAGWLVESLTAAPKNYKNLKEPADTGAENYYRLTKVSGDLTVTITTAPDPDYVPPVDKTALEAAVARAEALTDRETYTQESLAALEAAVAAGNEILADPEATQAQVDQAAAAILAAIAALEKKPDEPTEPVGPTNPDEPDPTKPDDPTNPDQPTNPTNPDQPTVPTVPVEPTKPGLPCTSDETCPGLEQFTDMPARGNWAHNPIDWAVVNEITNGMTETTFVPGGTITRGQAVTFLWRAAGKPAPEKTETPFTDLKEGAFYYDAVLWAVEKGITNGMTATTFVPGGSCTRGQIVTFLYRFAGSPEVDTSNSPFTDLRAGAFYTAPVAWAVENGITNGMTATTFAPDATCTRAQVVTFLYREQVPEARIK